MADDKVIDRAFEPGSFGCHEALHMASFLAGAVDEELCEHSAIVLNEEWLALAQRAREALVELYNRIGAAHLPMDLPKF